MKQIILIRHAKVDLDSNRPINASFLKEWVAAYDVANIDVHSLPNQETINVIENSDLLVTSSLGRAIDSAKMLNVDIYESSAIFNEAKIPETKIPFVKLKPKTWLVVLRVLLLFGLGKKDASLKASKLQAKEASVRLLAHSQKNDSVVLIGHGGMNWLIRKVLMKEGWRLEPNSSNKNWGMTILIFK